MYVIALYTFGSFHGFQTDPMDDLEEVRGFIANPPEWASPRPQDSLRVFELVEVEDGDDDNV